MKMILRILAAAMTILLTGCACTQSPQIQPPAEPNDEIRELAALLATPGARLDSIPAAAASTSSTLRQHTFQTFGRNDYPCVDPTGRWLVFSSTAYSPQPNLFLKSVDGKTLTQLTDDPAADIHPAFSPDGRSVAFSSNRSGAWEIYIIGIDGRNLRQLTSGGGNNLRPSFSGDGSRIVFCCQSDRSGQWELWITPINGGARQFVGHGMFPAWSPTEDVIAFQRPRQYGDRLFGIWTVRLNNNEPSLPTLVTGSHNSAAISPTFSPDGKRLAFTVIENSGSVEIADVFAVGTNGENLVRLTQGEGLKHSPTWGGDRIFFSSAIGGTDNIWSVLDAEKVQPPAAWSPEAELLALP